MKCPSCGRENPESAIRWGNCRTPLHDSIDDRTMDSPGQSAVIRGDAKPSLAPTDFKDTMARTPSGHSPSQSCSGGSVRARVLEPGDELGPRFQIDELLGEGGMGRVYKANSIAPCRFLSEPGEMDIDGRTNRMPAYGKGLKPGDMQELAA